MVVQGDRAAVSPSADIETHSAGYTPVVIHKSRGPLRIGGLFTLSSGVKMGDSGILSGVENFLTERSRTVEPTEDISRSTPPPDRAAYSWPSFLRTAVLSTCCRTYLWPD